MTTATLTRCDHCRELIPEGRPSWFVDRLVVARVVRGESAGQVEVRDKDVCSESCLVSVLTAAVKNVSKTGGV